MKYLVLVTGFIFLSSCGHYENAPKSQDPISCQAQCSRAGMSVDHTQSTGCGCKPRSAK